jgi:hypothetical protein
MSICCPKGTAATDPSGLVLESSIILLALYDVNTASDYTF